MKEKEAKELAVSVGVLVEKILKLVLRDNEYDLDEEEKDEDDEKGGRVRGSLFMLM